MGDFAAESNSWPLEDLLEQGKLPSSTLEWTEREPESWFESGPICGPEPGLFPQPDPPGLPSPVPIQEEGEGRDDPLPSFKFTTCSSSTSASSSPTTVTISTSNLLRTMSDSRSDHEYSQSGQCIDPQGQEGGGGTASPDEPRPTTSRAVTRDRSSLIGRDTGYSTERQSVIGRNSGTQHISDRLRQRGGGVIKKAPPPSFVRMTKTALKSCHTQEIPPEILLRKVTKNIDPSLFSRLDHDMDTYSNLEEFSLLKSSTSRREPLTIAVASPEAAHIFKSCFNAMNCYNHSTMIRPPYGPASPSSCIIGPSVDSFKTAHPQVEEAIRMSSVGMAAAPRNVDGLPPQCSDWVPAPALPLPQYRTDFDRLV